MRRVHSVRTELIRKSREAALSAVQTFNNPLTTFKSESFIVLMVIAWMYLLHAYYRGKAIDYHYYDTKNGRKRYDRTKSGARKAWELERCLNEAGCPIESPTKSNLRFLIGLRHEIEHQLCLDLDDAMAGRYLACCLNYERTLTALFGEKHTLEQSLSLTLQFKDLMAPNPEDRRDRLPLRITKYIQEFDSQLPEGEALSPHYALRFIFIRRTANHPGQADRVIEFFGDDTVTAKALEKEFWTLKEVEKTKRREKDVVAEMHAAGFPRFNPHHHRELWKKLDAKNPAKAYAIELGDQWFWYDNWLSVVRQECELHKDKYGPLAA